MNSENQFSKLPVTKRWNFVEETGEFLGNRIYRSFEIDLYIIDMGFVEVWRAIGFQTVHWVELISYDSVVLKYSDQIKLLIDRR